MFAAIFAFGFTTVSLACLAAVVVPACKGSLDVDRAKRRTGDD